MCLSPTIIHQSAESFFIVLCHFLNEISPITLHYTHVMRFPFPSHPTIVQTVSLTTISAAYMNEIYSTFIWCRRTNGTVECPNEEQHQRERNQFIDWNVMCVVMTGPTGPGSSEAARLHCFSIYNAILLPSLSTRITNSISYSMCDALRRSLR